jgi:hypothetical protein
MQAYNLGSKVAEWLHRRRTRCKSLGGEIQCAICAVLSWRARALGWSPSKSRFTSED